MSASTWRTSATVLLAAALLAPACRHNPVHPDIGTLYVTSEPSGAEVLLDDKMLRRSTPLKLDGVGAGDHRVTLRYCGYRVTTTAVTVTGGASERLAVALRPVSPAVAGARGIGFDATDMAYDQATGRIYLASYSYSLGVYQAVGAQFTTLPPIPLQSGNQHHPGTRLLAVSPLAGKLYAMLNSDSLVVVDVIQQQVVKRYRLPDTSRCLRIAFSDDGRWVYAADSLGSRVWRIDARADTVAGSIALPGPPSDLLVDPSGDYLYVTILTPRLVAMVHARTGQLLNQSATGASPGGLFFDDQRRRIGFCNRGDKQVVNIDLAGWVVAIGPVIYDIASYAVTGLFARDRTYQWLLTGSEPYWQGDVLVCQPGYIHLIYCPGQRHVARYPVGQNPIALSQSADGRYLYVLNRFTRSILVYCSDTD
ncbi:MAG: PEGA domain-containing protein [Candidatus Edwardsbacteria bacterium]|nr:PEGA domain-containing protein [Candidatus Edwardsbacteria bacterium]